MRDKEFKIITNGRAEDPQMGSQMFGQDTPTWQAEYLGLTLRIDRSHYRWDKHYRYRISASSDDGDWRLYNNFCQSFTRAKVIAERIAEQQIYSVPPVKAITLIATKKRPRWEKVERKTL